MNDTQVIIAGAGPSGLLAAINLVKSGIDIRIFESKLQRSKLSRALAIHAGTLEYLEATHPALLKKFLERGKKIQRLKFGESYELNVSLIPSRYNFVLLLEQEESEEILEEYLLELGCKVERGFKVIDVKSNDTKVTAIIQKAEEEISVDGLYLLDCSGAHSIIRKEVLKLSFKGEKYFGRLVMGDVKVTSSLDENAGYVTSNDLGFAGFLPLTSPSYFRVILIPQTAIEIPQTIDINFFQKLAKSIAPHIELDEENKWLTSFEIHKRIAAKMRVHRIFLLGDAAHIHSPVGGQGMNLGMHDALNITNKLKRVLIDLEDPRLLDLYEKQRRPIIENVLRNTNAAMRSGFEKSALSQVGFWLIRKVIAPVFFKSEFLQKRFCIMLSQIKAARQEIAWMKS